MILDRFFPVPRFLDVAYLGVDISDRSVRYVGLTRTKDGLQVSSNGERRLPAGAVVRGIIEKKEGLIAPLKEIRRVTGTPFVKASLPEEQAYIFELSISGVSESDLRGSVELQLEEHVPLDPASAVFDYQIVSKEKDTYFLSVTAFSKDVAESYAATFEEAGFTALSFEVESQAVSSAAVKFGDERTYMIVDFGDGRTGISIVRRGVVVFTSTIEVGGRDLTEAIAKQFSLSKEDAEKAKREYGFSQAGKGKDIFSAVLSPLSALRDEINRHYIYWHSHKDEEGNARPKIEQLILCGGDANLKGAVEYFETSLHLPTIKANVWQNINPLSLYVPPISYNDSLTYATAIGLSVPPK